MSIMHIPLNCPRRHFNDNQGMGKSGGGIWVFLESTKEYLNIKAVATSLKTIVLMPDTIFPEITF